MTRNVKWRITAIVLLLMAVTNGMAQMSKVFMDTTYKARNKITFTAPIPEINKLPLDPKLYKFNSKTKKDTVAVLLRPGDYSKYYKGKTTVTTPNLWVFEPNDTKTKFQAKVPNPTDRNWQRFCQFLGLDTIVPNPTAKRDTIIYLEVELVNLFRPAYITDIHLGVISSTEKPNKLATSDKNIINWFANEQCHNTYPWTRLGYTYDWGHPTNHVGATEFILKAISKPKSYTLIKSRSNPTRDYDTVADFSR